MRRRIMMGCQAEELPPVNQIWYWADAKLTLSHERNLSSHTFAGGKGILTSSNARITAMSDWFYNVQGFAKVRLPDCCTNMSFYLCRNLEDINIPASLTTIGSSGMAYTAIKAITLPDNVTLGQGAFSYCAALKRANVPASMTQVPKDCFRNCSALETVTLPEGITSIGIRAFASCPLLALTSLPESVTSIADEAFDRDYALALTSLPSNLSSVGTRSFFDCRSMTVSELPGSLTTLGTRAFNGCSAMTVSHLPVALRNITVGAFASCTSMMVTELDVDYIGFQAFLQWRQIPYMKITSSNIPTMDSDGFYGTWFPIYVPDAQVDAYKTDSGWSRHASRIKGFSEMPV